jgi:phospholipase D1/2
MDSIAEWFMQWAEHGPLVFAVAYFVATLLPLPTTPFTLAAGALFGFGPGLAVVAAAQLAGSTAAFLLGRHGLCGPMHRRLERHPRANAARKALIDEGWKGVALFQLSPVLPFGLQNYLLGASHVGLRPFVVGTALAMLPLAALFVFAGAQGRQALADAGPGRWALVAIGIIATVLLMGRIAKRAARRLEAGD